MGKNSVKRRQLRHKLKGRAAALAGAAIMTGAAISGIPISKAAAAEAPLHAPPQQMQQTVEKKKDTLPPGRGWHQHKYSWPSPHDNQAWYQDGKIYYRSNIADHKNWRHHAHLGANPIDYVKDSASFYGFNPSVDAFSIIEFSRGRSVVEVRQQDTGKRYHVFLERTSDRAWEIVKVSAL